MTGCEKLTLTAEYEHCGVYNADCSLVRYVVVARSQRTGCCGVYNADCRFMMKNFNDSRQFVKFIKFKRSLNFPG